MCRRGAVKKALTGKRKAAADDAEDFVVPENTGKRGSPTPESTAAYYLNLRDNGNEEERLTHGVGRFYSVKMSGGPLKGKRQRCRIAEPGRGGKWAPADQSKYRKS